MYVGEPMAEESIEREMPDKDVGARPLHDRVLVKRLDAGEKPIGGIIVPDTAKEKPQQAEVKAVGSGKLLDSGERVALEVKAGDRILFGKDGGAEIKIEGEEYLILREDEILGVLDEPPEHLKKKLSQELYDSAGETEARSRSREPQFNIREAAISAYAADLPEPSKVPQPEIESVQRAADVLGSERVAAWMQKSIPSLGGRTPYSLLGTEEGRKQVDAVLGRIEHGVY